jgi:hypothetical protein
MSEHKFTTLGLHIGDRPNEPYLPGETRVVEDPNSVQHLVEGGTLGKFDAKAEKAFLEARKKADEAEAPAAETKA